MKKVFVVAFLMLAMSGLALAQDFPKFEIFGGYSYLRSDLNFDSPWMEDYYSYYENGGTGNLNGFEASFTYNLNSWLGIKADFSGHFGQHDVDRSEDWEEYQWDDSYGGEDADPYYHYTQEYRQRGKADVRRYTYMFGPEFSYRGNSKVRPFAHALFGASKAEVRKLDVDWTREYQQDYNNGNNLYAYRYLGNISGSFSNTGFAMALGGGLDINVNDRWAIRLVQVDYMPTFHELKGRMTREEIRYYGTTMDDLAFDWAEVIDEDFQMPSHRYNNLRLSAGVVIRIP